VPRPTSILRNAALACAACLGLAACRSAHEHVVPGCPHCGDPVTVATTGGNRVLPRLRLPAADVDPISTALRWPPFSEGK
jgi:hypothetical protein